MTMVQALATWMFWIWGILGFLFNALPWWFNINSPVIERIGYPSVETSTYYAVGILFWIAGMVLFGFGALISDYSARAVAANAAGQIKLEPRQRSSF